MIVTIGGRGFRVFWSSFFLGAAFFIKGIISTSTLNASAARAATVGSICWLMVTNVPKPISLLITSIALTLRRSASSLTVMTSGIRTFGRGASGAAAGADVAAAGEEVDAAGAV